MDASRPLLPFMPVSGDSSQTSASGAEASTPSNNDPTAVDTFSTPTARRLAGRTIALLEARRSGELAQMVAKQGGVALLAPALREEMVTDPAIFAAFLDALQQQPPIAVVFQTGVGVERLFTAITGLGRSDDWQRLLTTARLIARGPKPATALRALGWTPTRVAPLPSTTGDVIALFSDVDVSDVDVRGQTVAVQQYGERNAELVAYLERAGARVVEVEVYRWALPEDTQPLRDLLHALPLGGIDAVAFTSQAQVGNLFTVAEQEGLAHDLPALLRRHTTVASVGPVTSRALAERGIAVTVEAQPPKSGPLVAAIATHLARRSA